MNSSQSEDNVKEPTLPTTALMQTWSTQIPRPLPLNFFPGPVQRGLPPELRLMVYDEVVKFSEFNKPLVKLLDGDHWIAYWKPSKALSLLRNGYIWENDASTSLEIQRGPQAFTLLVSWEAIAYGLHTQERYWLLELLKAMDVVYAMDLEHQRTSTAPRKWAAPLHNSTIRDGTSCLWSCLQRDQFWRFRELDQDRTKDSIYRHTTEQFIQTMILQLRRKPQINIRIFVYSRMLPWYHKLVGAVVLGNLGCRLGRGAADEVVANIKKFLAQLSKRQTLTGPPRPPKDTIRYRITLVSKEDQIGYWKAQLREVEQQVRWEKATPEEIEAWNSF
ncbi:hypothetical protein P171DRAFT_485877 [Karstenula rhodostoma CBS 690.94]|uniref:Uncharacterized protein n=1 Tax=Karstenula rhodostoma CBS 690.94 TaxID=1392251 RepID=A0A9P4PHT9_9PLEO|nr:hypothetical protein P171DRAFT_485877 [Karstenula rhodostoma CBS 690.94]